MSDVSIVKLIQTRIGRRGKGKDDDPIRGVTQYCDMAGNLVFEVDDWVFEQSRSKPLSGSDGTQFFAHPSVHE